MEGFTASKYRQLVSDKKPKLNMNLLDNALAEGLENFTLCQNIHSSKEGLVNEINTYLEKYKDASNKIIATIETFDSDTDHGLTSYTSNIVLNIVQKLSENNYLKEQGKKFAKEPYAKKEKVNKYNKNKQ